MEKKIDIKEVFSYAWETFKANPVQHILVMIAFAVVSQLSAMIFMSLAGNEPVKMVAFNFLEFATVTTLTSIFLTMYSILQTRKSERSISDMIRSTFDFELWWKYFIAYLLISIAITIGLVFFIVPGIILAMGLVLTLYLIIDYKSSPVDAIKKSWEMTKGYKMQIFFITLVSIVINVLGALALLVGLLVSMPVTFFAFAHVYNVLSGAYDGSGAEDEESEEGEGDEDNDGEEDEEFEEGTREDAGEAQESDFDEN